MRIRRSISVAQNEGGMTMIELSMAAVVILGAVITMMAMFDTAIDILRYTTSRSLATQIGNQALENIRSLDYAQAIVSEPTSWPVDADLDTSSVPPKFKDIDDSSGTIWRSLITTDTVAGLQVEQTVVRQRITFIIRTYVMYVDDGADTDAFKRLVVKVKWIKTAVEGEVVMTSNFSREDTGESRPLAKILGIRSTNYDYFKLQAIDTTHGIDDAIRGPATGVMNPEVWVEAVVTGAKAHYIDTVDFSLFSPTGSLLEDISITSDSVRNEKYFVWDGSSFPDFNSNDYADGRGYFVRIEATDDLGKVNVDGLRFDIDNTVPPQASDLEATSTPGANLSHDLTWLWTAEADDETPELARWVIWRDRKHSAGSGWDPDPGWRASIQGYEESFIGAGLVTDYNYRYYIYPVDRAGNRGVRQDKATSGYISSASDTVAPTPVSSVDAEASSWKTVQLTWDQTSDNAGGSGVGGYDWWATDDTDAWTWTSIGISTDTASNPPIYRDSGLKPGRTYYYAVRPFDVEGNFGGWYETPFTNDFVTTPMR